ncbi:JmjC domain-containing protein [Alteromonas sp. H39]|uniref:JmjC domain-containing protein n=1 Tax=Alteromonas sp. H39 TaxID=3389876 RepID=UPI0039E0853E
MTFSPSQFLSQHWQKSPVVLRRFFTDFEDPIDEHDLAGLAQEEDVDSRIIAYADNQWHVTHGPIASFDEACQGQWTLLVQAVDRYIPEVSELMAAFDFIPYWRMDDVMISFANPGAGVGPHEDQYDVFLIQGKGSRQWRVGEPGQYTEHFPHPNLRQLQTFPTWKTFTLYPGDVLYIPPGWPHDGIAESDCLTYSIGFRAPDTALLAQQLAEGLIGGELTGERYSDPELATRSHPAMVNQSEITALKQLLLSQLSSTEFDQNLMRFLSDQQLPYNLPDSLLTTEELCHELEDGATYVLASGCHPIYPQRQPADHFLFYVNGEQFTASYNDRESVECLLKGDPVDAAWMRTLSTLAFMDIMTILINKGYWERMDT